MDKKSTGQAILHFPLTRIVVGLLVCGGIFSLSQAAFGKLLDFTTIDKDINSLLSGIVAAFLAIVTYTSCSDFTKNAG